MINRLKLFYHKYYVRNTSTFRLNCLGVKYINKNDIFLCSYPKSGNTWIRFLIANYLSKGEKISFRNINQYVLETALSTHPIEKSKKRPIIKTHFPFFSDYPKIIYIVRDPRDVAISFYHYLKGKKLWDKSLSEFIRVHDFGYGTWEEHIIKIFKEKKKRPSDVHILRYEDLLDDTLVTFKEILSFLRWEILDDKLQKAVENSKFKRLQKSEISFGTESLDQKQLVFFRSGKRNQWQANLEKNDLLYLEKRYEKFIQELGY